MTAETPFGIYPEPALVGPPIVFAWTVFCALLARAQRWTDLTIATVLAGVVQWPLIAFSGSLTLQLLVDVSAAALVLGALVVRGGAASPRVWVALGACAALVAVQAARSGSAESALLVVRQLVLPVVLALAVWSVRERIAWARFGRAVAYIGIAVSVYMLVEWVLQRPLVGAAAAHMAATGESPATLRQGQPSFYYADGVTERPWFRPGGPFLNPPIAGIFVGTSVYAAARWLTGWRRGLAVLLGTASVGLALARAGMLMVLAVTLVALVITKVGRWPALAIGTVVAGLMASRFLGQGDTASHGQALWQGLESGILQPWGTGFGNEGYFAQREQVIGANISESWLGVMFASVGIVGVVAALVALVAAGAALWRAAPAQVRPATLLLAVLGVCALSESAGAMRGTPAMWMLAAEAVAAAGLLTRSRQHREPDIARS